MASGVVRALLTVGAVAVFVVTAVGNTRLGEIIYLACFLTFCGIAWRAVLRRPGAPARRPWALLALGQSAWLAGDMINIIWHWGAGRASPRGVPDVFFVAGYLATAAAIVLLARRQARGRLRGAVLDMLTFTCALGIGVWQLKIALPSSGDDPALMVAEAAYPLADLILAATALLLVLSPGVRGVATRLLLAATAIRLVADVGYALPDLNGPTTVGLPALIMLSDVLIVAAIVTPGDGRPARAADRRRTLHPARLVFLGLALLTAPVMAVFPRQASPDGGVLAGAAASPTGQLALLAATMATVGFVLARFALAVREQERAERRLAHQVAHDPLTGLANRRTFNDALASVLGSARGALVCYVDLDGFKAVNDGDGHEAGDAVLVTVAARLSTGVRTGDLVARLGGDEFAVLCPGELPLAEATGLAERLLAALAEPIGYRGGTLRVGGSIGLAMAVGRRADDDPDGLLRAADHAMYEAKRLGRGRWVLARGAAGGA